MIDSQAVDLVRGGELEQVSVRGLEHGVVFHPQGGEIVDVEKAPIVDLVGSHPPVRNAIRLRLEQGVQRVEAARLAWRAVELLQRPVDRVGERGLLDG